MVTCVFQQKCHCVEISKVQELSSFCHSHRSARNAIGGAFIFIRENYAKRLQLISPMTAIVASFGDGMGRMGQVMRSHWGANVPTKLLFSEYSNVFLFHYPFGGVENFDPYPVTLVLCIFYF